MPPQTASPRQAQVGGLPIPPHSSGRGTQFRRSVGPIEVCTQAYRPSPHCEQSATNAHSSAGTHGPQQSPSTLAVQPGWHIGGI